MALQIQYLHTTEIQYTLPRNTDWKSQLRQTLSKSQSSHIKLTPPQKISAMSDTKCLCLPLSAPPLLLLSRIAPPAQCCPCSCTKPLQSTQQRESLPFHGTDGKSSTKKSRRDCDLCLFGPEQSSPPKLRSCHLHSGCCHVTDESVGGSRNLAKSTNHQPLHLTHWSQLPFHRTNCPLRGSTVCSVSCPCLGNITLVQLTCPDVNRLGRLLPSPMRSVPGLAAAYNFDLVQAW